MSNDILEYLIYVFLSLVVFLGFAISVFERLGGGYILFKYSVYVVVDSCPDPHLRQPVI